MGCFLRLWFCDTVRGVGGKWIDEDILARGLRLYRTRALSGHIKRKSAKAHGQWRLLATSELFIVIIYEQRSLFAS